MVYGDSPVKTGLSLPLRYVIGEETTPETSCFAKAFGKSSDCLAELKDYGISSIELRGIGPDSASDDLLQAAQNVLTSGMHLTLHGYLSDNAPDHLFGGAHPQLCATTSYLRDQQEETVVVVHALTNAQAGHHTFVESTLRALERLAEDIHAHDLPVRVGLEISRYHGLHSPGTTYEGLLDIAQTLDDSEIGFCWDVGHTHSSFLQDRLPEAPPSKFVERTIHTHLHGLAPDGDTHRPLIGSSSHIESAISQLRSFGYNGTYNLELYPTRWGVGSDVRDGILDSILCLQGILDRT